MDDDEYPEVFCHYSIDVSMIRLVGRLLLPSKMTLKLGIDIIDEDEVEFALNKVEYWFDNYVSRCIALSCQNIEGFDMLLNDQHSPRLDNNLMITVEEPGDHHLLFIFQSKIEALADGAFTVATIEIKSDNAQGLHFVYVGNGEGELPDMEEWVVGPNWFDVPWWKRCDSSMIDTIPGEGADLTVKPAWANSFDHLRHLPDGQDAIVIRGDFEPKIIDGDDKKK